MRTRVSNTDKVCVGKAAHLLSHAVVQDVESVGLGPNNKVGNAFFSAGVFLPKLCKVK